MLQMTNDRGTMYFRVRTALEAAGDPESTDHVALRSWGLGQGKGALFSFVSSESLSHITAFSLNPSSDRRCPKLPNW